MKRINKLTVDQKSKMDVWADKWIEIGLRTGDADRPKFEEAVKRCYEAANIPWHGRVIWTTSPLAVALSAPIADYIIQHLRTHPVRDAVDVAVRDAVDVAVDVAVHDAVGGSVHDAVHGAVDVAVSGAVGDAVSDAVGVAVHDAVSGAVNGAVDDAVGVAVDGAVSDAVDDAVNVAVRGAVHGAVDDAVNVAVRGAVHGAVDDAVSGAVSVAVSGAVSGAVGVAVHDAVDDAVHDAVGDAVHDAVGDAVGGAVRGAVRGAVGVAVHGAVHGAVGVAVSDAVHAAVDDAVSDAVGVAVHGAVGVAVSDAVHAAVDDAVSVAVGDAVDGAVHGAVHVAVSGAVHDAVDDAVGVAVHGAVSDAVSDAVGVAVHGAVIDAVSVAVHGAVHDAVGDAVGVAVHAAVRDAVSDAVGMKKLKDHILKNWQKIFSGQFWPGGYWWGGAFTSFFREVCDLELTGDLWERGKAYEATIESACWWYPHRDFVIVSERPTIISRELTNPAVTRGWGSHRLHSLSGPAVGFRDGWGVYSVHGVRVQPHVIDHPDRITIGEIANETNAEVRRVMIDQYGTERYMQDSGAFIVHKMADDYPLKGLQSARLLRKDVAGDEPIIMLDMLNSTPEPDGSTKRYLIRIDPAAYRGKAATDCVAAMASTYRLDDGSLLFADWKDYSPLIET